MVLTKFLSEIPSPEKKDIHEMKRRDSGTSLFLENNAIQTGKLKFRNGNGYRAKMVCT